MRDDSPQENRPSSEYKKVNPTPLRGKKPAEENEEMQLLTAQGNKN